MSPKTMSPKILHPISRNFKAKLSEHFNAQLIGGFAKDLHTITLSSVSLALALVLTVQPSWALPDPVPSSTGSSSAPQCSDIVAFGEVRPEFKGPKQYDIEIRDIIPVKDQGSIGTCHLHAWSCLLEMKYYNRTGTPIKISAQYLSVMHWQKNALKDLRQLADPNFDTKEFKIEVSEGSDSITSFSRIVEFGIVPELEGSWHSAKDFTANRLRMKIARALTMRRGLLLDAINRENIKPEDTMRKRQELIAEAEKDIQAIFQEIVGTFPTEFEYQGVKYTPQSFAKVFFPEIEKPRSRVDIENSNPNDPITESISGSKKPNLNKYSSGMLAAESLMIELLKQGHPIYLSIQAEGMFIDVGPSGVMSVAAFNYPPNSLIVDRGLRREYELDQQGHAVVIVGVALDELGQPKYWKIKNSWSTKVGAQGYFNMYTDFARNYVKSITFLGSIDLNSNRFVY